MKIENRAYARRTKRTLRLQCEANEKLLLAGLRTQDEAAGAFEAQRRAQDEASRLRAREEELCATAEFRERLIGIIGHDLRNPLNGMLIAGGLLVAHGNLTKQDERLVNLLVKSGRRMARMVDQLAEFTRASLGGGFPLKLAPGDLGSICHDVAEELRIGSAADIRHTMQGSLAGTWDCDLMSEAVSNIAGNAVDYATRGTAVLIDSRDDGGVVAVQITNQGSCIPPDELPAIFRAFSRAGINANERPGHLGLGLYIACEIVRSHGGTIGVRSSDGSTTFTLRVPRTPKANDSRPSDRNVA